METDDEKVARLRELIPATSAGIYLDTAYRGPLPAETAAAMRDAEDWELRVGRATEGREEDFEQRVEEARAVIAALIGADPDEITLTSSSPGPGFTPLVDPNTGAVDARPTGTVDATLASGAVSIDVKSLNVDALFLAADRWLLGPEATGAIWRRHGSEATAPAVGLARTSVLGLARSIGWLEMYVELPWIYERTARLVRYLRERLVAAKGVDVLTPADALAGIVCFQLTAWPIDEALNELRRRAFAIVGLNDAADAIRASVAWFNTDEEIERFTNTVAEIAVHTPETLPRRLQLIVH
jgi:selenocysteine lyase/cysteine desulfurase